MCHCHIYCIILWEFMSLSRLHSLIIFVFIFRFGCETDETTTEWWCQLRGQQWPLWTAQWTTAKSQGHCPKSQETRKSTELWFCSSCRIVYEWLAEIWTCRRHHRTVQTVLRTSVCISRFYSWCTGTFYALKFGSFHNQGTKTTCNFVSFCLQHYT